MSMFETSLQANRQRIARTLRWPENIGIEMRDLMIGPDRRTGGLLVWVDRLAAVQKLPEATLEALRDHWAQGPEAVARAFPLQRVEFTREFDQAVNQVLSGWLLLLVEGRAEALLLETRTDDHPKIKGSAAPDKEDVFSTDLRMNVALVRGRLRSPGLLALPVKVPTNRSGGVALVYLEEKADPVVVRAVRLWAACHVGEEMVARGNINPFWTVLGLLSRFDVTPWPNQAAPLLDAGAVMLLVDRIESGYLAPVTVATAITSTSDAALDQPLRRWLLRARHGMILLALLLPGAVVSLLNYHQEMIPTAFLLAIGATRENAPFATVFDVLLLEILTEIGREASFRLPMAIPLGLILIVYTLIALMAVLSGLVGPVPALAAVVGSLASLTLPTNGLAQLVRIWRFYFLAGGLILGFFGMATVFGLFVAYLCQARSWGVPFFGPSGSHLTSAETNANRPPKPQGGRQRGKTLLR